MLHRRVWKWRLAIIAVNILCISMHAIKFFGAKVIRLEILVSKWPSRRDAFSMLYNSKVVAAKAWQGCAVNFAISTDEIMNARNEFSSLFIKPFLIGLVAGLHKDFRRGPVLWLARHTLSALQNQRLYALISQCIGGGCATYSRTNNDHIRFDPNRSGHCLNLFFELTND